MGLPWEGDVKVSMYDVRGRHVATVWDGRLPAGQNELPWQVRDHNGSPLAAGVYYYRVLANLADGSKEVRGSAVVLR